MRILISTESSENVEKLNISFDEHNEIIEEFAERAVEKKYDKESEGKLEYTNMKNEIIEFCFWLAKQQVMKEIGINNQIFIKIYYNLNSRVALSFQFSFSVSDGSVTD